jgi:hypothetical protein
MISEEDTYEFIDLDEASNGKVKCDMIEPSIPLCIDERISFLEQMVLCKGMTIRKRHTKMEYLKALEILAGIRPDPFTDDSFIFIMDKYNNMVFDDCYHRISFLQDELCKRGIKNIDKTRRINMLAQLFELEEIAKNYDDGIVV